MLEVAVMLSIDTTIAELVLDHSECAAVFDRYRLDYCCKGARSLRVACEERHIDAVKVLADCELAIVRRAKKIQVDPRTLTTKDLITTVIAGHHRYLHRTLPFLQVLAQRVARAHGERQPGLRGLAHHVDVLTTLLFAHLQDEEQNLFPALLSNETELARPILEKMREEHSEVGVLLDGLRSLSDDYTCPSWGCNRYRTLVAELANLEADTLRHVHVENHVLLPRFLAAA